MLKHGIRNCSGVHTNYCIISTMFHASTLYGGMIPVASSQTLTVLNTQPVPARAKYMLMSHTERIHMHYHDGVGTRKSICMMILGTTKPYNLNPKTPNPKTLKLA